MRVILPLRNQNQKQVESSNPSSPSAGESEQQSFDSTEVVSEEVEVSTENPSLEPETGPPEDDIATPTEQSSTSSSETEPAPPKSEKSREKIDSSAAFHDSSGNPTPRISESESPSPPHTAATAASTRSSTVYSSSPKTESANPRDRTVLKPIAPEASVAEVDKNRKRKTFQAKPTCTDVASLERKPSAKKLKQKEVSTDLCRSHAKVAVLKPEETKMVEKKSTNHGRDYENRYSFEENSQQSENDPAEMRTDSAYFDDQENDPASAMGEYTQFETALKQRGLEIKEQEGDGNCLFRAISLQIYGDSSSHAEIRKRCLDFMARDEEHFAQFVTGEPFQDYINRKRHDGVHGNNPEIQAISELFNRPIEVYVPENGATPLNIFHAEYKTADAPIRLSYHDGNHYNAVVDPLCPTAGLGLGLPGLEPGLADRMQVAKAVEESDKLADEAELEKAREASHNDQLQRAIKESTFSVDRIYKEKAIAMSDLEATEIELEQAALMSSLETYQHSELGRKQAYSSGGRRRQGRNSPPGSANIVNRQLASAAGSTSGDSAGYAASSVAAIPPNAAASVAAVSGTHEQETMPQPLLDTPQDEYPQTVQELVMNGFELSKVVRAYELVGDNFDDILALLLNSNR